MRLPCVLLAALLAWCGMTSAHSAEPVPLVAAASDLQFALREAAQAFHARTGQTVKIVYGSSGNLAAQIREGAPFQMLLAADEKYVEVLAQANLTRDGGKLYARGRLALFVPRHSTMAADGNLQGLRAALLQGRVERFAIANPEHAPYGRAAREALQHAQLWQAIEKRLVIGENVVQAAQFAGTPGTSGGLIAYSLALSPAMRQAGRTP